MASEGDSVDYDKLRSNARKGAMKANKKAGASNTTTYVAVGLFGIIVAFVVGLLIFNPELPLSKIPVFDPEYTRLQNEQKLGFTQGENLFFADKTLEFAKLVSQNGISQNAKTINSCITYQNEGEIVPAQFDLRVERESCMAPVQNQGNCSSGYAFATSGVTSERLCMSTNGLFNDYLSAQDMVSCSKRTSKCASGNVDMAWNQIRDNGLVDSHCFQYTSGSGVVPECSDKCEKAGYKVTSVCATAGEGGIMREIKNYGPVVGLIQLYSDFLTYKSGIYEPHISATRVPGAQAVEIVGWGVDEKDVQYWIVKNSWGESWGEQGYAYVKKGVKDLGLEDFVLTATPVVPESLTKGAEGQEQFESLDEVNEDSTI